jgi:tripartite-type tricarboxylate transporter receptor subunit TctC
MRVAKRAALCFGLAGALAAAMLPPAAAAQETYPARPVRIVFGFGPGAAADVATRVIAQKLSQSLGQPFTIENRTGAGSNLAAEAVARAPKDGYTLFLTTVANTIVVNKVSFDVTTDFAPIVQIGSVPNLLVAHPEVKANSVPELIALAKARPGEILFASSGAGTSTHLSGELFNERAGVRLGHVPYTGSAQASTDLLGGRVHLLFTPATTVLSHVQAGKLKALAVTQQKRAAIAPDVPSMAEAGLKDFDTSVWFGLLAPTGVPADVVTKVNAAVNDALKQTDALDAFKKLGIDPVGGTPQAFGAHIKSEVAKWERVVQASGVRK